jgi:5'-deoxynucleotidase YfbR-like HD superfamily hydrolase
MTDIFSEMDARLSVISRWVVVNTIKRQSVAEHCFNVERIARRIANDWFDGNEVNLDRVSQMALHHDDDESVIGDIPSPAKDVLSERYLDSVARAWYNVPCLEHDIVKLADKMEAYWFLAMESKLGNTYIDDYRREIKDKVLVAAQKFGPIVEGYAVHWLARIDEIKGRTHGWVT